jgi:hypothetical protein
MNIINKLIVIGAMLALMGCVTGPKRNANALKPAEQMPPEVKRMSPDEITESNFRTKAVELEKILSAELDQSKEPPATPDR